MSAERQAALYFLHVDSGHGDEAFHLGDRTVYDILCIRCIENSSNKVLYTAGQSFAGTGAAGLPVMMAVIPAVKSVCMEDVIMAAVECCMAVFSRSSFRHSV